jgi:dnd system-associated protein 4
MKEGTLKEPDRLYIEKADRELYNEIKGEDMFSGKDTRELFIIAAAFGFKNKIRKSFQNREGYVRTEYLTGKDKALLYAIALKEADSVDILSNKEEVFKIAEEYAHGGVRILHDSIGSTQFGSFSKQFEKMLHEIYEELMSEMV